MEMRELSVSDANGIHFPFLSFVLFLFFFTFFFILLFSKSMTTCEIPPLIPVITKGVVGHEARLGGAP